MKNKSPRPRKSGLSRREFIRTSGVLGMAYWLGPTLMFNSRAVAGAVRATLEPMSIGKYVDPLIKPPAMPGRSTRSKDKYRIAVRQFSQQILPRPLPATTVWSYGSVDHPGTVAQGGTFNYPALTIEAVCNKTTQVLWRNDLVDERGNYLPHLLPVDQTLHWANPPGGLAGRDSRGHDPEPYKGPVPWVTHVHGAHTDEDSDGYAEAWYLPDANDIPDGYATTGTFFDYFNARYDHNWKPGTVSFKYPNDQPAATLWYHDHTLGMTRLNVYAGAAGFWLIRGGPNDLDLGYVAPGVGDSPLGEYTEIPLAIQDRSFNVDGSFFYPDNRAFFEGLDPSGLQIPFIPELACDGQASDVSPIWNPEFFGNVMLVNGRSWPYLEVNRQRYRLRLLNGCNSRFLILDFSGIPGVEVWQIGGDQGFLPAPFDVTSGADNRMLLSPAERADVIVDFTHVPPGHYTLRNLGPDEPFGGGAPGVDFEPADPATTGQVMQFVVRYGEIEDPTSEPMNLVLPAAMPLGPAALTRAVSLNEEESATVRVGEDGAGRIVLACGDPHEEEFGPIAALLGTLNPDDSGNPLTWSDPITENPVLGATETWEIYNFTVDAHPIHIHQVKFEIVGREPVAGGASIAGSNAPLPGETGYKDTVIAYPGEVTRVKALYDLPGFYVWHCHIVEHEDNEMMRPFHVGPIPPDAPAG